MSWARENDVTDKYNGLFGHLIIIKESGMFPKKMTGAPQIGE